MKTFGTIEFNPAGGEQIPHWQIEATPAVMIRLKRIFPRLDHSRTGHVTISHTAEVARDLKWVLERFPLDINTADRRRLNAAARDHLKREDAVGEILNGQRSLELDHQVEDAYPYQVTAGDLALKTGGLLIGDELGLGKTLSGLLILRDTRTLPALVVTLTHLVKQWEQEIARWFPMLKTHILRGTRPYDPAKRLRGFDPDVLVTSYSKLQGWGDHLAGKVNAVIFDEIQELRRNESFKYKAAGHIADKAQVRVGLSGTPVMNYGGEIYNVISILNEDALGSRPEFEREWGKWLGRGHLGVENPKALGSYLRDEGLFIRRTREDVGVELPDVVRVTHTIESDEKVIDEVTGEAIDLADAIMGDDREAAFTASGQLDGLVRLATGEAKAPFVAEFVRMLLESESKIVLFGWHHNVYNIWEDRLTAGKHPIKVTRYTGKESVPEKERAKTEFIEGDAQVLMMSLRSGAGLNGLQDVCDVAVFGELDWSPGMHDQCIGRLNRPGQKGAVMAYFLVSEQGADPIMADVLNLKRQQAEQIRDPNADLFAPVADTSDRVKDLAQAFLERKHRKGHR